MKRLLFSFIFCLSCFPLISQIIDDFEDGDLMNPTWEGDVNNFIVNASNELQLNASVAGTSNIYLSNAYVDSMSWEMYFKMDFSPSSSNLLRVYLGLDQLDLATANGYYFEIGESGSTDAFQVFRLDEGASTFLASGTIGALGSEPAEAFVRILRDSEGVWQFYADYESKECPLLDFEFFDESLSLSSLQYFMIECNYTSTRVDKFFFDDIRVEELMPDMEGPQIVDAVVQSPTQVLVRFNEPIDPSSLTEGNFVVSEDIGTPSSLEFQAPKSVLLNFNQAFGSGSTYVLEVSNVTDLFQNSVVDGSSVPFFLTVGPEKGDLLVNEILFDPYPNGADFVELYNNSDKILNLKGVYLENTTRDNDVTIIENDLIVMPMSYVALTEHPQAINDFYTVLNESAIVEQALPAFNNDRGNISVYTEHNGSIDSLDSYDYSEDDHFELLDDVEGVSLERLSFLLESSDPENWHSASQDAGFATPGYKNSQFVNSMTMSENPLYLENKTFSPNQDGDGDLLIINYDLDEPGYLLNMKVFDRNGRFVKDIANNLLLGQRGFVKWDGTNENNEFSAVGVYIIWSELIRLNGDIREYKNSCILADFLD